MNVVEKEVVEAYQLQMREVANCKAEVDKLEYRSSQLRNKLAEECMEYQWLIETNEALEFARQKMADELAIAKDIRVNIFNLDGVKAKIMGLGIRVMRRLVMDEREVIEWCRHNAPQHLGLKSSFKKAALKSDEDVRWAPFGIEEAPVTTVGKEWK